MMLWIGEFIWSGMVALGLQFLLVGARVRFDPGYGFFGYSLLLLAGVLFGSAWGAAGPDSIALAWIPLTHLLALPFFATTIRFFCHATDTSMPKAEFRLRHWCLALMPLFLFDTVTGKGLLVSGSMQAPRTSTAYAILFAPCLALFLGLTWRALFLRLRSSQGAERRRIALFAAGWSAFTFVVIAEEARLLHWLPGSSPIPTDQGIRLLIGAGLYAVAGAYLLMQRFLSLHRSNGETLARLGEAYAGLQESAGLKAIGASAASISHEIRNYAATLKGNSQLLLRNPGSPDWSGEVERIRLTAERMEAISMDIAAYRSPLASGKLPLRLDTVAGDCARLHFPEVGKAIVLGAWPQGAHIEGDARTLSQVFFNLFKNAMEAGARRIDIRFRIFGSRLIMGVEDDGSGCPGEALGRIAMPFFTSKGEAGTGLGCSIAEAILAEHRATFRAYSKNAMIGSGTGLVVNMVFPLAATPDTLWSETILVVSESPEMRAEMVAPLIHLGIHPTVFQGTIHPDLPTGSACPPIFIEDASATGFRADWGGRQAIFVNCFRLARLPGRAGDSGMHFLFSEENLADLVLKMGHR